MEAKVGGKAHHFFGPVVSDLKAVGKRTMEWDLNDWTWDGDLFTAAPLNSLPLDCRSRQFFPLGSEIPTNTRVSNSFSSGSEEITLASDGGKRELEKRRRIVDVEDEEQADEPGSLNLKLGGHVYPITEGDVEKWEASKNGKKTKVGGPSSNRPVCQVEDCRADLSNAKDYHRRHKVCDLHSKATRALVGNVMQRFCQQCSRFHVLQEFDEGKRSCRRRLAGHNRRRRKTHPVNEVNSSSATDERSNNYLLISLLRILSNIHSSDISDQTKDQDVLSHLLRSLASIASMVNERNLTGSLPRSQDLQNAGTSDGTPAKDATRSAFPFVATPASEFLEKRFSRNDDQDGILQNPSPSQSTLFSPTKESISAKENAFNSTSGKTKLNNIDLNNVYDDSQDFVENLQNTPANLGKALPGCPLWVYQDPPKSSPPHTSGNSGNSGSISTQSPSSSSGDAQSRTDRIVFKLFGKEPGDFPLVLRKQILDWLSHSPTDIESYIRPGCIILTIYLRMDKSTWEELSYDLRSSLRKLLDASTDPFWRTGWIYARVQHRVAFVHDGHIVLDTPLLHKSLRSCRILNIKPIAVCAADIVEFSVRGFNLSRPSSRLLCALEGKYLVHSDVMGGAESFSDLMEIQTLSFSCTIPNITGRGFIEVEDHGLSSSFFPFIVAEKDVCSEICTLESIIEAAETADGVQGGEERLEARNQALNYIHEMGWLLHKCQLKFKLGQNDPNLDLFPFKRFKWLIEFSIEHDWCAVVRKLLNLLFSGSIDAGQHSSVEDALLDIGLLHKAVRRNSRSMVEVLLRYDPEGDSSNLNLNKVHYLFRPDMKGPGGLTPLHIAAGRDASEHVLDALTDDPGLVGVDTWRSAVDATGLTPNDYACLRGHYSYVHLVQKKINKKSGSQHVVLEIPGNLFDSSMKQKVADKNKLGKVGGLQSEKSELSLNQLSCRQCEQKWAYGRARASLAIYRPAMLSLVAIAAVCVCVALLFKSSPEVLYVFRPFRWELLDYGSS